MKVVSLRQTLQNHQFIFNLQEKSRVAILTDISREVAIKPKTISTALLNPIKISIKKLPVSNWISKNN